MGNLPRDIKGGNPKIGVSGIMLIHSYSEVEYILAHLRQVKKIKFGNSHFVKWTKCKKNILILFLYLFHIDANNSGF